MLTCQFENGNTAKLRHVVVDTLLINNGKILLVKRAASLPEGGKWGLVGGYVERDETLLAAASREIREETGYAIEKLQFLTIVDTPDRSNDMGRQNISFVCVGEVGKKVGDSDWEVTEQRWFDLSSLPPENTVAFDHYQIITLYKEFLANSLTFPKLPHITATVV